MFTSRGGRTAWVPAKPCSIDIHAADVSHVQLYDVQCCHIQSKCMMYDVVHIQGREYCLGACKALFDGHPCHYCLTEAGAEGSTREHPTYAMDLGCARCVQETPVLLMSPRIHPSLQWTWAVQGACPTPEFCYFPEETPHLCNGSGLCKVHARHGDAVISPNKHPTYAMDLSCAMCVPHPYVVDVPEDTPIYVMDRGCARFMPDTHMLMPMKI